MFNAKQASSFLISFAAHLALLFVLFFFTLPGSVKDSLFAIDSMMDADERDRVDFEKKLDEVQKAAVTFTTQPGSVSTQVGGSASAVVAREKIEVESKIENPDMHFRPSDVTIAGRQALIDDIGSGEVKGSAQSLVRGYGEALDQLTKELIRLMRNDKLLVVWLFDESGSMKKDQQEIRERIGRVYEELRIVDREAEQIGISKRIRGSRKKSKSLLSEVMLTSIVSFGQYYHPQTRRPTSDLPTILKAIGGIPIDKSGIENTCTALVKAVAQHKLSAARGGRKLVVIVVSDESGDDGAGVELVIKQAKGCKAPVYILGREAAFGSNYAFVRWKQPETGHWKYLPIRRGPESPFPELLQHDGFRRRHDSHMSGFGPYEQVRICRETGGIFFQLPHETQDLNDYEAYKYAALALLEYRPDLGTRTEYAFRRDHSRFRRAIAEVVALLNPYEPQNKGKGLELPDPRYQRFSTDPARLAPVVKRRGQRILEMLRFFGQAINYLERVKPLRAHEPSRRWRANYDLVLAQLYWYQLRLFEYGIGMDQFIRLELKDRVTNNHRHNRWFIREDGRRMVLPDERNQKRFKITAEELQAKRKFALARLREVEKRHPGTPWAHRAHFEAGRPFGVTFGSYYQPPPKPGKRRPRRKLTPTPKL